MNSIIEPSEIKAFVAKVWITFTRANPPTWPTTCTAWVPPWDSGIGVPVPWSKEARLKPRHALRTFALAAQQVKHLVL